MSVDGQIDAGSYLGDVVMRGHEARMSIARPLGGGERSAATNLIKSYLRRGRERWWGPNRKRHDKPECTSHLFENVMRLKSSKRPNRQ